MKKNKLPSDWKYECPRGLRASGALCLFAGMIKIIGKEFSVCTAQAELVVNPRLGLRGELAPYMLPPIPAQEEIGVPRVGQGVLPSALVTSGAVYFTVYNTDNSIDSISSQLKPIRCISSDASLITADASIVMSRLKSSQKIL